jgi:glutamate racemase
VACIGVFDSGLGGLTVLAALRHTLPQVPLHYVADSAHAPYGERSADYIRARSLALADHLVRHGAEVLVMACNTATAHAADAVRAAHPMVGVVGIEPGIKPAVGQSATGRIGVLATTATVRSPRFQALLQRHAPDAQVVAVAAAGVAAHIEAGDLDSPALQRLVTEHTQPLIRAGVDTVLLGCTHYPLILPLWQQALGPQVRVLAVESAVAQQAARLWGERASAGARLWLQSTGDPAALARLGRLVRDALGWPAYALSAA